MSLQINQGLFKVDFADHYAVLGIPVDSEIKDIRKRYLKIARSLHPDSLSSASETEKQQATEILSKLVNPAYEKLSQEQEWTEYGIVLRLKGQQLGRQAEAIAGVGELATQLISAKNLEEAYKTSVQSLAETQYQNLNELLGTIGQISELNLVYLVRKHGQLEASSQMRQPVTAQVGHPHPANPPSTFTPVTAPKTSPIEQSYRRAEEFLNRDNLAGAILELRDALQIDPNNARCHGLLGLIYLRQNQPTMAKIHVNKALQIDPTETNALKTRQQLEKGTPAKAGAKPGVNNSKNNKPDKPGGGLFGLFGGKKK